MRRGWAAAKLVEVKDRPFFNIAAARNLGIAAAASPWLLITDADVLVDSTFQAEIGRLLRPGVFLRPDTEVVELCGTLVAARAEMKAVGGYDEVFEG